jgi:phosphoribosylaminoimidazole-succinocarboxamide synthase
VRDSYTLPGGRRSLVTTDRLSAFDRILAQVPYKGQVLKQLSAWWFERSAGSSPTTCWGAGLMPCWWCSNLSGRSDYAGFISGVTSTALYLICRAT